MDLYSRAVDCIKRDGRVFCGHFGNRQVIHVGHAAYYVVDTIIVKINTRYNSESIVPRENPERNTDIYDILAA